MLGESSDSKVIRAAGTKLDGFYKRLDEVGANRKLNLRWSEDKVEDLVAAD
jgi:hypothetical protein